MSLIKCVVSKNSSELDEHKTIDILSFVNTKSMLLVDSSIDVPRSFVEKAQKKIDEIFHNTPMQDITMDMIYSTVSLHINRQTEEDCEIHGIFFITKAKEEKNFFVCLYGNNCATINDEKLENSIKEISINEKEMLYIDIPNKTVVIEIEKETFFSKANSLLYSIYSRNKIHTIATTTILSVCSISYISNQAMHIKRSSDLQFSRLEALELINESLLDQNDGLSQQLSMTEDDNIIHFQNTDDSNQDSNETYELKKKDSILKHENSILMQECENLRDNTDVLKKSIKILNSTLSSYSNILRVNGFNHDVVTDEEGHKFREWLSLFTKNSGSKGQDKLIVDMQNSISELENNLEVAEDRMRKMQADYKSKANVAVVTHSNEAMQMREKCNILNAAISKLQNQITKLTEYILQQAYNNSIEIAEESNEVNSIVTQIAKSVE